MLETGKSENEATPAAPHLTTADEVGRWLGYAPESVDAALSGSERGQVLSEVAGINKAATAGDKGALYPQHCVLDRTCQLYTGFRNGKAQKALSSHTKQPGRSKRPPWSPRTG
ncbi:hypothetical protein RB628_40005 [Streptomyces sp. ADMS]|uniref:hypothetical protein n=1 Tax=Streptomyces sp. ADMS TaxID=3071415 RepID=UPI00296F2128|nr:hypothetical protein [Streptomyces sp. ADMS]MDW4911314.1 hypothetical protein [Streptomyces sp. ADMS]